MFQAFDSSCVNDPPFYLYTCIASSRDSLVNIFNSDIWSDDKGFLQVLLREGTAIIKERQKKHWEEILKLWTNLDRSKPTERDYNDTPLLKETVAEQSAEPTMKKTAIPYGNSWCHTHECQPKAWWNLYFFNICHTLFLIALIICCIQTHLFSINFCLSFPFVLRSLHILWAHRKVTKKFMELIKRQDMHEMHTYGYRMMRQVFIEYKTKGTIKQSKEMIQTWAIKYCKLGKPSEVINIASLHFGWAKAINMITSKSLTQ